MDEAHLSLENVSLAFNIYGIGSQSLKKKIIEFGTGGRLGRDSSNKLVVQSLSNISININKGDRLGIVGGNGAGKSTMLRVMAGIYKPQQGHKHHCGAISAIIDPSIALDTLATGKENIKSRAILLDLDRTQHSYFYQRVSDISELGDYLEMPVHTYSSGMMMRLNFALSIAIEPDILLLDEWLSVTDLSFNTKAENHMKKLVDTSRILVLASHNLNLLENICNRGIHLEKGEIKYEGTIKDAIQHYQNSLN